MSEAPVGQHIPCLRESPVIDEGREGQTRAFQELVHIARGYALTPGHCDRREVLITQVSGYICDNRLQPRGTDSLPLPESSAAMGNV